MTYRHIISFLIGLFLGDPWGEYLPCTSIPHIPCIAQGRKKWSLSSLAAIFSFIFIFFFWQAIFFWDSCCWAFLPSSSFIADKTDLLVIFSFREHSRVSLTKSLALLSVTSNSCGFNSSVLRLNHFLLLYPSAMNILYLIITRYFSF